MSLVVLAPFLPGAAHAVATVAVGAPFETVKTRLQVGMYESPWACVRATVRQEGPLALYRGALMPLASLVTKRPVEFAAFEWCNAAMGDRTKGPFAGGFVAGVISALMGCPFNVVKVQMQASRKDTYKNCLEAGMDVWRSRGPLGFYRGLSASLMFSLPATTFYLGTYGSLRERLPKSAWSPAVAGVIASLSMWTVMLPLDNVRTNIQSASVREVGRPEAWLAIFARLRRTRGLAGLWAGWSAVALRAPASSACSMLAYEQVRSIVDRHAASG
eukprot:TRINITY_DN9820_c0_g1_i1.p1 TRINITY_DN9820_c0_g1~~TRINITY_DN9820_c0_g1_i1.p1  ORF type:complete len:273 (+),score=36.74 TRINITY_DN9820_c0_g1_i1:96-914(+)